MDKEQAGPVSSPARHPRLLAPSRWAALPPQALWAAALTLLLIFGHALPAAKFFSSAVNYLPLHTVLEFVAMAVSAMVFALAWNLRGYPENSQRMILGAGFLAVCLIDVAHTLSYAGMPDLITPSSPEKAINFWLAGRYTAAAVLLAVALLPIARWSSASCHGAVAAAVGLAAGVWWVGIEHAEWLPRTFIAGRGLTTFKIGAEYALTALYGVAAILLFLRGRRLRSGELQWLAAAAWVQGLAEMFFTLYADVTDVFNLLGHVYKAIAYIMVYRAIFAAGVQAPYRDLLESEARFRDLTEMSADFYWESDAEHRLSQRTETKRETEEGVFREASSIGKRRWEVLSLLPDDAGWQKHRAMLEAHLPFRDFEILRPRINGAKHYISVSGNPVFNAAGEFTGYRGVGADITERKKAEARINELAFFDQLTGLPNRALLMDRLRQTMTNSSRNSKFGALLFIDLDNFKALNDTLGHDIGDQLLRQVAQRLTACVRAGDTVARLGGDEFVVILPSLSLSEVDAANQTEGVGEKILAALNQTYQLQGIAYRNTPSIGATLFQGDLGSIDDLLKQADLAMYKAKDAGRNALRFFDPDMELVVMKRAALESDLRAALQEKQFLLHFQAQIAGGRLTGAEVLVRWLHPQRGLVPPGEFIPLAEETGLILPLGRWVMETACRQLSAWAARPDMAYLTVAVNVSAHQFRQPDFVDQVLAILKDTGANPRLLKLELTESLLVSSLEEIIDKMFALKTKGVGFSLDDFGTGYSSLAYLKRLPLDQLKIDQSFVNDVLSDANDAAIAKTIIALGQSLGLGVIAEGVETKAQRDFLASNGCLAYQGYFFSRPLPIEGFEEFAQRA